MLAMRNIANQEPVVFSYICFPLQDLADNYIASAVITLPFLSFFSFPHSICLIPFLPRQPQLCSSIVRGSGVKTSDWRRKVSDFTSTFFFLISYTNSSCTIWQSCRVEAFDLNEYSFWKKEKQSSASCRVTHHFPFSAVRWISWAG